jgi:RNA polymerase sigma factor (TIGR02999 family)
MTSKAVPQADAGELKGADKLLALCYDDLRALAAAKMSREAPGHALQPAALVHEAWLRLGADHQPHWANRAHFFSAAANAMRRILVETARRRKSAKAGGGQEHTPLEESVIAAPEPDERFLQVRAALELLEAEDPANARIVRLRYFGALSNREIAFQLGVNEKTVRRHWGLAKVRLVQIIRQHP